MHEAVTASEKPRSRRERQELSQHILLNLPHDRMAYCNAAQHAGAPMSEKPAHFHEGSLDDSDQIQGAACMNAQQDERD